jgi:prepilin-type N-terminal cleavage/methylation domain-containing protein
VVRRTRALGAFTLVELLVVLAVVALLAAILFPVFRAAKGAAMRASCISNFKQTQLSTVMYLNDYDDRFMPVNYNVAALNDPNRDRTWVQLLMPYVRSFGSFVCPADHGTKPRPDTLFDGDVILGDTYRRYYRASLRSNVGYNYLYYSPVYFINGRYEVRPKSTSEVGSTSGSLTFVDSVYDRTPAGAPTGGGSYIVVPPCRYVQAGNGLMDSFQLPSAASVYAPIRGWLVSQPNSAFRYGLAWPWHDSRLNVALISGGVRSTNIGALSAGCDVQDLWAGTVKDSGKYEWDVE